MSLNINIHTFVRLKKKQCQMLSTLFQYFLIHLIFALIKIYLFNTSCLLFYYMAQSIYLCRCSHNILFISYKRYSIIS